MISSPCKLCEYRGLPKDLCLPCCEKIKSIQQVQHFMDTPPYGCNESAESASLRIEWMPATDD